MEVERGLGFEPVDREFERLGYDIESRDPRSGRGLRFIEVKGRRADAATVTVTKNEILYSLNMPDSFILALVEFLQDGGHRRALPAPPLPPRAGLRGHQRELRLLRLAGPLRGAVVTVEAPGVVAKKKLIEGRPAQLDPDQQRILGVVRAGEQSIRHFGAPEQAGKAPRDSEQISEVAAGRRIGAVIYRADVDDLVPPTGGPVSIARSGNRSG